MTADANFQQVPRRVTAINPFAGIPVSDYFRDVASLALLLTSLALPWDFASAAIGHIEVILITLLSIVSLSLMYLARAGVLPASITTRSLWVIRLAANVPYLVLVFVYLLMDAFGGGTSGGGVGFAIALGLAGALLAAQPREIEVQSMQAGDAISRLWYRIAWGYGIIAVLSGVLSLLLVVAVPIPGYVPWSTVAIVVISILLSLAAFALTLGGIIRRNDIGRVVALTVGVVLVVEIIIDLLSNKVMSGGGVESVHAVGYGAIFLAALVGLASAPPLRAAMNPVAAVQRWFGVTLTLFTVAASIASVVLVMTILVVISGAAGADYTGFGIGTVVALIIYVVVAVIAKTSLRSDASGSRNLVLALVGVMFVLGIVHVILAGYGARIGLVDLFFAFGMPVSIAVLLLLPAAVRQFYSGAATLVTSSTPLQMDDSPTVDLPPAPPTTTGFTAAQALDPTTDPQVLFEIARDEPSLRPQLAANPATYPQLLEWLAQFDDPEIRKALEARSR